MLPGNKAEPHRTCKAGHSVVETCTFLIHSERSTVVIRLATAQPRWRTAAALSRHTPVTTQDLNLSESYQQVLHIFQSDVGRGSLGKRPARQRGWSTTEMQGKVVLLWRSSAQKKPEENAVSGKLSLDASNCSEADTKKHPPDAREEPRSRIDSEMAFSKTARRHGTRG
ncbi:hypothetical protein TGME49_310650 [Toxoplasma gondii ME49]|uniref:Uncharacterized protein n=3 Tax=Toxoplasma gondii TaxID=5811 RepID=B6KAD3_TOXGV|nr:hypothetical protein TGME49_310650 [Toxoplasma gondii ME49]EPT26164.1 hypothetical protein TGME49_310650 [Toxoplasma gondii ME49]ESS34961.1 hypothetical protein TGVEG_310650 [Toxoplasma gondii VEG]KYF47722.1 hypothetical protein TGARI_310650 [Toxoplasma gondii ARI]|eukprot:XP_018635557.1 hypothetical protein TGME49_310650 [Toxoplasma gondii ME49]